MFVQGHYHLKCLKMGILSNVTSARNVSMTNSSQMMRQKTVTLNIKEKLVGLLFVWMLLNVTFSDSSSVKWRDTNEQFQINFDVAPRPRQVGQRRRNHKLHLLFLFSYGWRNGIQTIRPDGSLFCLIYLGDDLTADAVAVGSSPT